MAIAPRECLGGMEPEPILAAAAVSEHRILVPGAGIQSWGSRSASPGPTATGVGSRQHFDTIESLS